MSSSDESATTARAQLEDGCALMDKRLHGLLDSSGRVAEEIHAIRKLGKSLRGGFSLFGLGEKADGEIQAIGRLLSGPRDAVSRANTWTKLGFDADPAVAAAVGKLLEQQAHGAARRPPPETVDWALERVKQASQNLASLAGESLAALAETGLKKLRREIRTRARNVDRRGKHDFHDLRKALKAYLGALGFLPQGAIPRNPAMVELADLLGDENDIATLSEWLKDHGFTRELVPALWKSLKKSRRKLQNRVIRDVRNLSL